ncbi:hypothetical protein KAI65_02275 [Candidatus Parcubacteria bacterium]|nr:hypothetical protein [Candidatus Parcubacteria bacterium]
MRKSTIYQNKIEKLLIKHFSEIKTEWAVSRKSTDSFRLKSNYAPRLDIAIGPFNVGNHITTFDIEREYDKSPQKLKEYITNKNLKTNNNPRCTLAVEVVFSGSSKHILGDITNASVMGLYGFVVANDKMYKKIQRIFNYTQLIKSLDKVPNNLFNNVSFLNISDFENFFNPNKKTYAKINNLRPRIIQRTKTRGLLNPRSKKIACRLCQSE